MFKNAPYPVLIKRFDKEELNKIKLKTTHSIDIKKLNQTNFDDHRWTNPKDKRVIT